MSLLMGITQYCIVPYDTLSYFFLALAAFLIIDGKQSSWNTLMLCFVIILATLTRETSSLILAFYAAINYNTIQAKPKSIKVNQAKREMLIIIICFAGTYVGLRYLLRGENVIYQNLRILENINPLSLLSVMFFGSIAIIVSITQPVSRSILVFYIASLPYTVSILLIAEPWEIRLWIPIILLVLLLKIKAVQVNEKQCKY